MSVEVKLPELGENVENGDVVNVMVREGDMVAVNDGLFELETDKAVIEIPSTVAGKVVKIHCGKGDTVVVGQTLLTVEPAEAAAAEPPSTSAPPAEETPAAKPAPAPAAAPAPAPAPATPPAPAAATDPDAVIPAGPAARRVARELGVDLRQVAGSGQHGRIQVEDVQATSASPAAAPVAMPAPGAALEPVVPPGEPGQDKWGPIRRERMSKIRRTIAAQMVKSATTIPQVTNFDDADITELEKIRKSVPPGYLGEGVKLTSMPFVIKAVALALRRHPALNASLEDETEEVVYKQYVNLGIAVDSPRGLVVPVIRQVDQMPLAHVARELGTLAVKARASDFAIEDLRGGTFTISNLGAIGGAYSTPIINHPEVAILLLGRSRWLPMVREGNVEPRLMMPLSLSYDHRLVDGATAGRFLNEVIDLLQSPGKLLLAG